MIEVQRPDRPEPAPARKPIAGPVLGLLLILGGFLTAVVMVVGALRLVVELWPW